MTYKYKDSIIPFVFNPEPKPQALFPSLGADGSEEYTIGCVREPRGLGDVVVQEWVRPMLICPTPEFDWGVPVLPVAVSVGSLREQRYDSLACSNFSCGDTSRCFRCAAKKSEANTFCGEAFVVTVAHYTAAVLRSKAGAAPNMRENPGAFMLWMDGVLSRANGALAKDISHYGGMLISPVLLFIKAKEGILNEHSLIVLLSLSFPMASCPI